MNIKIKKKISSIFFWRRRFVVSFRQRRRRRRRRWRRQQREVLAEKIRCFARLVANNTSLTAAGFVSTPLHLMVLWQRSWTHDSALLCRTMVTRYKKFVRNCAFPGPRSSGTTLFRTQLLRWDEWTGFCPGDEKNPVDHVFAHTSAQKISKEAWK